MTPRVLTGLLLTVLSHGCQNADEPASQPVPPQAAAVCDEDTPPPTPKVSPGGTPEVTADAVAAAACNVRLIDVRTKAEVEETGVIAGAEHIPLAHVVTQAQGWSRDEHVVFVCRSGRRSGIAAQELGEMGFSHVSSLTGGVLAWERSGRTLAPYEPKPEAAVPTAHKHLLTVEDIRRHVADQDSVRMTKAATLLLHGTQACVDGRDAHAIIGTPGGDAGELVLALATAETLGSAPFTTEGVDAVFAAYLEAFGHFYLHTDTHAAQRWLKGAGLGVEEGADLTALLRDPPKDTRTALLNSVAEPPHVGCGHLRLSLQFADDYGVRPGLVRDVLSAYFTRLWAGDERLEFVVLAGDHAESGILQIEMARPVHAYSKIPLVSPRVGDTEVFVVHPQVSAFVRHQNAPFLLEEVPSLMASGVDESKFLSTQQTLAEQQLRETIRHLAPDLPVFTVEVGGESISVRGAADEDNPQ